MTCIDYAVSYDDQIGLPQLDLLGSKILPMDINHPYIPYNQDPRWGELRMQELQNLYGSKDRSDNENLPSIISVLKNSVKELRESLKNKKEKEDLLNDADKSDL